MTFQRRDRESASTFALRERGFSATNYVNHEAAELAVAVISVAAVEAAHGNDFDVSLPKTFLKGNADVCRIPLVVD